MILNSKNDAVKITKTKNYRNYVKFKIALVK